MHHLDCLSEFAKYLLEIGCENSKRCLTRFEILLILMLDKIKMGYFIPIQRPTLLLRPVLLVGIPVAFAIERLAFVTPNARFHEKVRPGPSFIKPPNRNSNLDLIDWLGMLLKTSLQACRILSI